MDDLTQLPFFRPFPHEALAGLAQTARWLHFSEGQTVLDHGDQPRDVYFVATGTLRVVSRGSGGQELILNDIGPGAVFGELAVIDGATRSAGIVALTTSKVCAVPAAPFLAFVLATPAASLHLMRSLVGLIREKDTRLFELSVLPVRARLVSQLLRLARPRAQGGRIVSPPRTHEELASRIGTRREVVSRAMAALQRDRLLEQARGGMILPQPDVLERELQEAWRLAGGG